VKSLLDLIKTRGTVAPWPAPVKGFLVADDGSPAPENGNWGGPLLAGASDVMTRF
jgi:hypothetical protein